MYVCMYVCMCMYVHVCACMCMYVHVCACISIYLYIHIWELAAAVAPFPTQAAKSVFLV